MEKRIEKLLIPALERCSREKSLDEEIAKAVAKVEANKKKPTPKHDIDISS